MVGGDGIVGRAAALQQVQRALPRGTVFVRGEAGLGKTALLRAAVEGVDAHVAWGTCVESGAPGFWPWTQALTGVVRAVGLDAAVAAAGHDRELLAALVPALGTGATEGADASGRGRLLLMDAAVAWLLELAATRPLVVVLDDLQWADASTLALLEQLVVRPRTAPLALLAAYRSEEAAADLVRVASQADQLALQGLDRDAVADLVARVLGAEAAPDLVERVWARAGGHPLFTRELALADGALPDAVRQAVARRVGRLQPTTQAVLATASLMGNALLPDVLAEVHGGPVDAALAQAEHEGLVTRGESRSFAHDVFREAVLEGLSADDRAAGHAAVARALDARASRGAVVPAADLARHHTAALGRVDLDRAVHWALLAVQEDVRSLALDEAGGHARRLRGAVVAAGQVLPDALQVDLLLAEADALARADRPSDARGLVRAARDAALRAGDAGRLARTALAAASLGARFATRRDEVVAELEEALAAVTGDPALEARLTAVLARELQHSVPEERVRSAPLTERALALARDSDDPDVLRACLLARHDVLWTPGSAEPRASVAAELVELARRRGDQAWLGEALLLEANALLEAGSARFAPLLAEALELMEAAGRRYTVLTRRACLALMRGELDEADALVEEATALGEQQREPDTHNVRMSQRLELVRARSEPEQLLAFAEQAVAHWTGAPVHAHGVAAGFCARAGDLDLARHHLSVVQSLGSWRTDRSYLWSVYVRELATAAAAVGDLELCAGLLDDIGTVTGTCGVNGAVVAFAGCHSRPASLLAAALGDQARARALLAEADAVEARLGVRTSATVPDGPSLTRTGQTWEVRYDGRTASVPHSKGMSDLAVLLARPREDVHVLDLVDAGVDEVASGPALDRTAVAGYRARLEALSAARLEAEATGDEAALARVDEEHQQIAAELGRATGKGGRSRAVGASTAERARKAVAGRLRDAVRRLEQVHPPLGAHLSQSVVTGVRCRYAGELRWRVSR